MTTTCPAKPATAATGPKTAAGKAVSARNATTHGLFCRQTVLPHLGEDPAGYQKLLDALHEQLRPRNLMERQYLELWADASWKMRRLSRLEAQAWEDDALDEDARLTKLERLARLQTALRRQLDRAVRMLSQDVPHLFAHRTREDVMAKMCVTETLVAESPFRQKDVEIAVQANRHWPAPADDFTDGLDNAAPPPNTRPDALRPLEERHPKDRQNKICQNEPLPGLPHPRPSEGEGRRLAAGERKPEARENKICQNEPIPCTSMADDGAGMAGLGTGMAGLGTGMACHAPPPTPPELQELEDLLNSGTLSKEERRALLMRQDIPGFSLSGGRIKIHK